MKKKIVKKRNLTPENQQIQLNQNALFDLDQTKTSKWYFSMLQLCYFQFFHLKTKNNINSIEIIRNLMQVISIEYELLFYSFFLFELTLVTFILVSYKISFLWYIFWSHDYYTNTKISLKRSNIIFRGNSYIITTTSCPRMIKFFNIVSLSIRCRLYWLIISNCKWNMHYYHTCNILLNEKSILKFHLFLTNSFFTWSTLTELCFKVISYTFDTITFSFQNISSKTLDMFYQIIF